MNGALLVLAFASHIVAAIFFSLFSFSTKRRWDTFGDYCLKFGFGFLTVMVVLRWYRGGRPPFANLYEALALFAWSVTLVYIIFDFLYKARILAIPVNIVSLILLFLVLPQDSRIKPLMPALQSNWMGIHVMTYFIGYAALALAFFLSIMYLAAGSVKRRQLALQLALDNLSYQLIIFAFPFLTIGMTTGSAWAHVAWGSYWAWDPKETCSLITWLVYAVYLHARLLCGWRNHKAAWLLVAGFLATLFTFIGVNYILPGLHSYAQ